MKKIVSIVGGILTLTIGVIVFDHFKPESSTINEIAIPAFSVAAQAGARAFSQNCVACHGENGSGSDKGPPLIHDYYNPGHHSDAAFYMAVQNGVRAHHWSYGNMPPLRHVTPETVADIVLYIREMQAANGIVYKKHTM